MVVKAQQTELVSTVAVSIPDSAVLGAVVPVSIQVQSQVPPASVYAMRVVALWTVYPYNASTPVSITVLPTSALNGAQGNIQTFNGSFTMPAHSVTVQFAVQYQVDSTSDWVTQEFQSGNVLLAVTPSQLDINTIIEPMMSIMMLMMLFGMMSNMMKSMSGTFNPQPARPRSIGSAGAFVGEPLY